MRGNNGEPGKRRFLAALLSFVIFFTAFQWESLSSFLGSAMLAFAADEDATDSDTDADTSGGVASVYIKADYSRGTPVLTAILTDFNGDDITYTDDDGNATTYNSAYTYTWYKSIVENESGSSTKAPTISEENYKVISEDSSDEECSSDEEEGSDEENDTDGTDDANEEDGSTDTAKYDAISGNTLSGAQDYYYYYVVVTPSSDSTQTTENDRTETESDSAAEDENGGAEADDNAELMVVYGAEVEEDNSETADSSDNTYTSAVKYVSTDIAGVHIQNDIYRYGVFTAILTNSDGDYLYFTDDSATEPTYTTYNSGVTYTWYRYKTAATTYVYTDASTDTIIEDGDEEAAETIDKNTLIPTMGTTSYYYYVTVTVDSESDSDTYTSGTRIATVYDGISVEIEQVKNNNGTITLNMIVYDENGDIMYNGDGSYYYNTEYTTTWYKSKEYFASTGDGTTADEYSEVTTDSSAPLGYAPQDYYTESNYMRVSNAAYNASTNTVGYTNTITVEGEVGRYYYVDINTHKTNGSAEAGADPVFVRNCTSTVVIEDHIAENGTFQAVVYDKDGNRVSNTDSYTYTWYVTVSGTSTYTNSKDESKTSEAGRFVSSYDKNAYYFDSGCFTRNNNSTNKSSEYGGTSIVNTYYDEVRDNFSEELALVSEVFASANYTFNTNTGSTGKFTLNDDVISGTAYNDGSTCNVATDEGQLRYYYVEVTADSNTTYKSSVKYVKYSNQIENGGFQDSGNSTQYDASLTTYWQTTNKGYTDSADNYNFAESYYRMRPLLEIATYTSANAYGTYGNYYSYPGLSYDKENIETQTEAKYLRLNYDDDSTTDYLYSANQFCEINSTDNNTLYQTVMTVPKMPLYWSLTHHARTSSGSTILNANASNNLFSKYINASGESESVGAGGLGASEEKVWVAIDIMYVVIMNETDAEKLLANGDTLAEQQGILNTMIKSITDNNNTAQVIQTSEDGISYLARYDGSYTYPENSGTTYNDISVWRVQTGSTKVELTFNSSDAENAAAAANNKELFEYYAETYGTVKSYSYTSGSNSYATFYTESQTYADEYTIPEGQYVSRYFFVAGNSTNTPGGYSSGGLSFGSYTNDNGEEVTVTNYNGVSKATNTASAGNFIDNVVFTQQLDVEVNYWLYQPVDVTTTDDNGNKTTTTEWKYVLQSSDTETSKAIPGNTVSAKTATVESYESKYKYVGSYISVDGGNANTPASTDTDGNSVLGTATSFRVDGESALVLDLYYSPYMISLDKTILGLPVTMGYDDFDHDNSDHGLQITIYKLTTTTNADGNATYQKATDNSGDDVVEWLEYSSETDDNGNKSESLTLTTGYDFEKGYYLITEFTTLILTEEFDGWYSVDMSLQNADGITLQYDDDLGGFILCVGDESDGEGDYSDANVEISVVNTYKPIAVEAVKHVLFGTTDLDEINTGLTGSADYESDTNLNYLSLSDYDDALRSVDNTDEDGNSIADDSDRLAVLSGDTLTYRIDLASTGRANSKDVTVTDEIPEGCTLVEGSIRILKQERSTGSASYYGIVEQVLSSEYITDSNGTVVSPTTDSDGTTTWKVTDSDGIVTSKVKESDGTTTWKITDSNDKELFSITYDPDGGDSNNGCITWLLSEMGYDEQYYVEYAVTVDQIKASDERDLLTNYAEWTYLSEMNSGEDSSDSANSVTVGMKMTVEEKAGKVDYNITFSGLSNYTVTALKDSLPDGFVIDTSTIKLNGSAIDSDTYTVTWYDSSGDEISDVSGNESSIASFTVEPTDTNSGSISADSDDKLVLTFTGTQETVKTVDSEIRNMAGITYYDSTNSSTTYTSVIAYGDGITNQVETDVTHLYLDIEKYITYDENGSDLSSTDSSQSFLFMVEYYEESTKSGSDSGNGTNSGANTSSASSPTSVCYVDISCTEAVADSNGDATGFSGSQLVQVDRRGTYVITELTGWSNTDYDYESSLVTIPDTYSSYYSSDDTGVSGSASNDTDASGDASVEVIILTDDTSENAAYPTVLGTITGGAYPTVAFTNTESIYAYRSAQAYVQNLLQ